MTKKRKRYPDLNQKLERPWCYYCERDFDDLKILISHQKAKHFKCERCGRRLNTAGGLSVHMNQVHKENLTHVENANPGRQGLEIEVFGMEGVPADILEQHNQDVMQAHFAEEAERARLTGNPIRGLYANGNTPQDKKPKVVETPEEIQKRAEQFRGDKRNGVLPAAPAAQDVVMNEAPPLPTGNTPYSTTAYPPQGMPAAPPTAMGIPPRPHSIPSQQGALPPRPGFSSPTPTAAGPFTHGHTTDAVHSSLDELITGIQREAATDRKEERKGKKDKNMRLIYNHDSVSPEEKMAALPRFADFMRT